MGRESGQNVVAPKSWQNPDRTCYISSAAKQDVKVREVTGQRIFRDREYESRVRTGPRSAASERCEYSAPNQLATWMRDSHRVYYRTPLGHDEYSTRKLYSASENI